MFEKEAEEYVANKTDKGNFDVEKFGVALFGESSMRIAFCDAATLGYNKAKKRITELEKELHKYQISRLYLEGYTDAEKKYQKENADLKKIIEKLLPVYREWCLRQPIENYKKVSFDLILQAEAFLKEIK